MKTSLTASTNLVEVADVPGDNYFALGVAEVSRAVPPSQIERPQLAWNGIPDRHPVGSDEFQRDLRRGRPLRIEQRIAADQLIAQIEKTLAKRTYDEPLEKYGYRTMVVGMPLWFEVSPNDPF